MQTLCRKVIVAITCICALQFTLAVHTTDTLSARLSQFKQKAKDTTESIKNALTPSKIQYGFKRKLVKVNEKERNQLWTCQIINPDNDNTVVGKPINFTRDTTVTFDSMIKNQKLQVFPGSNALHNPIEITISQEALRKHSLEVLAVSNENIKIDSNIVFQKGIQWSSKNTAEAIIKQQKKPSSIKKTVSTLVTQVSATTRGDKHNKLKKSTLQDILGNIKELERLLKASPIGAVTEEFSQWSNQPVSEKIGFIGYSLKLMREKLFFLQNDLKTVEKKYPLTILSVTQAHDAIEYIMHNVNDDLFTQYLTQVVNTINSVSQTFEKELKANQPEATVKEEAAS